MKTANKLQKYIHIYI